LVAESPSEELSSMRLGKLMLVGSKIPPPLMELLLDSGSHVTRIQSGKSAVFHAHREMFDATIIVSTGDEMDVAETIFNLRDINRSMQVILLISDRTKASESEITKDSLERIVPNTKVMSIQELRIYLDSKQKEASR
jgi:hypothetical protein